jgi:hypothetical protein
MSQLPNGAFIGSAPQTSSGSGRAQAHKPGVKAGGKKAPGRAVQEALYMEKFARNKSVLFFTLLLSDRVQYFM